MLQGKREGLQEGEHGWGEQGLPLWGVQPLWGSRDKGQGAQHSDLSAWQWWPSSFAGATEKIFKRFPLLKGALLPSSEGKLLRNLKTSKESEYHSLSLWLFMEDGQM